MSDWFRKALEALPAWLPECLVELLKKGMGSLLHAAAILFGLVFCFLAGWDVIVHKREFGMIGFGTGASAIMGAWGALWQWSRYMKKAQPAAEAPAAPGG